MSPLRWAGCALFLIPFGHADAGDSPFVWEIQGPRARHCLVGTVHALPTSARFLPDNIEACYVRSQRVVLEAIGAAMLDADEYVRKLGQIAEPQAGGLRARVGDALYGRVAAEAKALGLSVRHFDAFRPWFAAEILASFRTQRSLARFEHGIDQQLYWRALKDDKMLTALETDRQRAELLTQMPDAVAVEHLAASLDDVAIDGTSSPTAIGLWLAGDDNGLERMVSEFRARYPGDYRRLLADRNRAWLAPLRSIIGGQQPALIVVSIGHLAGEESLRRMLWKERIATTPLRSAQTSTAGVPLP